MAERDASADPATPDRPDEPTATDWSVFGDPLGLAVFLVALAVAASTWRVGFFITDTYAVANGLVNLAQGHFTVERIHYSLTLGSQPGLHVVDGRLYARNYGQAVAALPAYYALEVLATVTRLEALLAGGWSLVVLGACRQVGVVLGRRRPFQLAGSALAVGAFAASLPLARPIDPDMTGILALQALSVLSVAVLALALYRLCAHGESGSRRLGAVAGLGALVATPLWFWAAVPKRHVLVAAAVATLLFWFGASRRSGPRVGLPLAGRAGGIVPGGVEKALVLRAMAYALAALVTWVHAFEGVVVLATLLVADLATVSTTSRRALVAVGLGLAVGFTPVLATNLAVSGNPVEPPRLTDSYEPGGDIELGPGGSVQSADAPSEGGNSTNASVDGADPGPGEGGETDAGDGTGTDSGDGIPSVGALAERIRTSSVFGYTGRLVGEVGDAPGRLYHTYVRSGRIDTWVRYDVNDEEAIELSLAESFPLVGGLAGSLVGWVVFRVRRRGRPDRETSSRAPDGGRSRPAPDDGRGRPGVSGRVRQLSARIRRADPSRQTGWFALVVFAGYAVLYFPLLPLHTQLTVRYILPAVPALVYLIGRCRSVRRAVATAPRTLTGSYAVAVLAGLAATVATFPVLDPAVGEAMQLHALVNLGICGALLAATALTRSGFIDDTRVVAVALGVTGGATTVLAVRMHLVYFEYGTYAVPAVRRIADVLAVAT